MKRKPLLLVLVALAMALAACGTGGTNDSTSELPVNDGNGLTAGACLAGSEDCDDLGVLPSGDDEPLFVGDEPVTPGPGDDDGLVLGGGMSIDEALANDIDGGFAIMGFYYDDGSGPLLCDALAESFPPQCGGPSIPLDNSVGVELDGLQTEQGVSWTDQPAVLVGEIVDGVFVVQDF